MDPITPAALVTAAGCAVASYTDLRTGLIRNLLTFPLMGIGIVLGIVTEQYSMPLLGLAAAFLLYWPLWKLGVQKGGDAKLWMAIGSLMGPWFMFEGSAWYALLYIPIGVAILIGRGRLTTVTDVLGLTRTGVSDGERPAPTELRTAPVISLAVAMAFGTSLLQGLF